MKLSTTKKSILTAVCIALCVVLPQAFHAAGMGATFLPMHIPVLLCGLICGAPYGLLCGLAGPALSHLFTQMPPIPTLWFMLAECAVYGLTAGCMMLIKTKHLYVDLYLSLVTAMIAGRIVSGIAKALFLHKAWSLWIVETFVESLPGIIIQLALIPTIVFALEKASLIPQRYPKD